MKVIKEVPTFEVSKPRGPAVESFKSIQMRQRERRFRLVHKTGTMEQFDAFDQKMLEADQRLQKQEKIVMLKTKIVN